MNSIISQYLQFVTEQQRGIDRIGNNIMNLNTRVTEIISLYAHSTNLRNVPLPGQTQRVQPPRPPVSPLRAEPIEPHTRTFPSDNLEQSDEFAVPPQGSRTLPRTPRSNTTERTDVVEEPIWNTIDRRSSMPINSVSWDTSSIIYRPPRPPPIEIPGDFQQTVNHSTPTIYGPINSVNSINVRRRNIFNSNTHRIFRFSERDNAVADVLNNSLLASPVRIVASHSQIRRGTELLMWKDISDNYQTTCPIDLNSFQVTDSILRIKQCSHIFKEVNLRRHFRGSPACPICRYDIRDYIENSETTVPFTSTDTSTG